MLEQLRQAAACVVEMAGNWSYPKSVRGFYVRSKQVCHNPVELLARPCALPVRTVAAARAGAFAPPLTAPTELMVRNLQEE